jgi:hypothetical protein
VSAPGFGCGGGGEGAASLSLLADFVRHTRARHFAHSHVIFQFFSKFEI